MSCDDEETEATREMYNKNEIKELKKRIERLEKLVKARYEDEEIDKILEGGEEMEEFKVGEYVRTKQGYISKLRGISDNYLYFDSTILNHYEESPLLPINEKLLDGTYLRALDYITKHSENIIDLIEVGDYVNGKKVLRINDYGDFKRADFNLDYDDGDAVYNDDIKTILTHEMYEQNCYKIGE